MTPEARARMRDAIAAALGRAPSAPLPAHPGTFAVAPASPATQLDRFRSALTALGGAVHEAASADQAASIVWSILETQPGRRVIAWDDAHLPVPDICPSLARAGAEILRVPPGDLVVAGDRADAARATRERLAAGDVGLTGAHAALAETGSIVLVSGPGRPRLASLLPPIHVALVRRDSFVESLAHLIHAQPDLVTAGSNVVCVTGPSRTADIENVLTRGVHGPREVHVVIV